MMTSLTPRSSSAVNWNATVSPGTMCVSGSIPETTMRAGVSFTGSITSTRSTAVSPFWPVTSRRSSPGRSSLSRSVARLSSRIFTGSVWAREAAGFFSALPARSFCALRGHGFARGEHFARVVALLVEQLKARVERAQRLIAFDLEIDLRLLQQTEAIALQHLPLDLRYPRVAGKADAVPERENANARQHFGMERLSQRVARADAKREAPPSSRRG